ncbi:MAG: hypothetical protein BGO10_03320 [Chlamydia sp. 32-24]|nr:MAG: hypothetical protein BGO10_03320 [Chlamydia sp. 32-24]
MNSEFPTTSENIFAASQDQITKNYSEESSSSNFSHIINIMPINEISSYKEKIDNQLTLLNQLINKSKKKQKVVNEICEYYQKNPLLLLTILGQLTTLIDHKIKIIEEDNVENLKEKIQKNFEELSYKSIQKVIAHYLEHKEIQIQNPGICKKTLIPIEISKFLILKNGSLNLALIPYILNDFEHHKAKNYFLNIRRGLKILYNNQGVRDQFDRFNLNHITKSMNMIIRLTYNLKEEKKIKPFHVKRFVLSGFLSHFRQYSEGSCFANSLVIYVLNNSPDLYLEDIFELLTHDRLIRTRGDKKIFFPYLLGSDSRIPHQYIQITSDGKIKDKNIFVWDSIDFKDCFKIQNIKNPKTFFLKRFKDKFIESDTLSLTIKDLLKEISACSCKEQHHTCKNFLLATAAFESHTSPFILQIWNNAIANMAEGENNSHFKTALSKALFHALQFTIQNIPEDFMDLPKIIVEDIHAKLMDRIQYLYDPFIQNNNADSGFVLYDRNFQKSLLKWVRIDNEEAFVTLLIKIIKSLRYDHPLTKKLLKQFCQYIESKTFIKKIKENFSDSNSGYPWLTKTGNDAYRVLNTYFNKRAKTVIKTYSIKNAKDLLKIYIDLHKQLKITIFDKIQPFSKTIPLRIVGVHACSLMFNKGLVNNESITVEEIFEKLLESSHLISETFISLKKQQKILDYFFKIYQEELKQLNIGSKSHLKREELIQETTYFKFRNLVVQALKIYCEKKVQKKLIFAFDQILFNHLSKEDKKTLSFHSIHFADTNWSKKGKDVHFCFSINPGTNKLEVWEVDDKGNNLKILNQDYWVKHKTWEYFMIDEDLEQAA